MSAELRDLWSELCRKARTTAPGIQLQLLSSGNDVRIFAAAVEPRGAPALLIELPEEVRPESFRTVMLRAFELSAPILEGLPHGRWGIVLELKDDSFLDLFTTLSGEVVEETRLAHSAGEALTAAKRCVDRWRRFLERRTGPLSDEEVRGLVGELVVLCRCGRRFDSDSAMASWVGPDGGLKDFELPNASVEVKTYLAETGGSVIITQPDQLEGGPERPVFLCAVHLARNEAHGRSLAEFVRVTAEIVGTGTEPDTLEAKLASAGYLPAHAALYPQRFTAGPLLMFAVQPGFPRISGSQIPPGVVNVRFAVSLAALGPFAVDPVQVVGERVHELEN